MAVDDVTSSVGGGSSSSQFSPHPHLKAVSPSTTATTATSDSGCPSVSGKPPQSSSMWHAAASQPSSSAYTGVTHCSAFAPNVAPAPTNSGVGGEISVAAEIAALSREMEKIQLQYREIVNAHMIPLDSAKKVRVRDGLVLLPRLRDGIVSM